MRRNLVVLVFILGLGLLVGCSGHERVLVPPLVDIGGGGVVGVLYFDNLTDDYALAYEIEQALTRDLSSYYRVLEPAECEWAMQSLGLRRGQIPTEGQAVHLGQLLGVDAVLVGEVSGYFAPISQTPPYATGKFQENSHGQREQLWEISQNTRAMVSFTARVISTRSGNIIYRKRVEGENSRDRVERLGWYVDGKKPSPWLAPGPTSRDVPETRKNALQEAVRQFKADLLPTYVWRKIEG